MEPLVAAHLYPRLTTASSRSPTIPSKADHFQSTMTERAYKAAALAVRALNVSSMVTAYQADLCEDMATNPDLVVWEEITVIMDICLYVPRQTFAQAVSRPPPQFRIPKRPKPQPVPVAPPTQDARASWQRKAPTLTPGQPHRDSLPRQPVSSLGRRRGQPDVPPSSLVKELDVPRSPAPPSLFQSVLWGVPWPPDPPLPHAV